MTSGEKRATPKRKGASDDVRENVRVVGPPPLATMSDADRRDISVPRVGIRRPTVVSSESHKKKKKKKKIQKPY